MMEKEMAELRKQLERSNDVMNSAHIQVAHCLL